MIRRRSLPRRESFGDLTPELLAALETGHDNFGALSPARGRRLSADALKVARAAWQLHRQRILVAWIRKHPGTRPWSWWRWDAPPRTRRRRIGGTGTALPGTWNWYGRPSAYAGDYDGSNPPRFEPEHEFLERHGLLAPRERAALKSIECRAAAAARQNTREDVDGAQPRHGGAR